MHKLSKGLKKKIKGKKGKEKEDDLFDPGELEKHRREAQAANNDESQTTESKPKAESEEWRHFLSLTAGVDSILQKTQEDLSRIKATSYYQRNKKPETPTETVKTVESPSVKPKWVGFEEGANATEEEEDETLATAADTEAPTEEVEVEPATTEPEEELNEEVDEDIFDTTYVDVVTSGEVKLIYVPESPTAGKNTEDDPFDTSTVEKVIGPLPTVQKKRNLVSIGKAVEVLTQAAPSSNPRRAATKRPDTIDLFSCLDEEEAQQNPATNRDVSSATVQSASSVTELPITTESSKLTPDIKDILAEFDSIIETGQVELVQEEKPKDSDDDEFDALAKESITKERVSNIKCPEYSETSAIESEDPFDTTAVERVLYSSPQKSQVKPSRPNPPAKSPARPPKPPPPAIKKPDLAEDTQAALNLVQSPVIAKDDYDPFDTSLVENVVQPTLSPDPFDTTTVVPSIVKSRGNDPIPVVSISSPTADLDYDPFDTSVADHVVP